MNAVFRFQSHSCIVHSVQHGIWKSGGVQYLQDSEPTAAGFNMNAEDAAAFAAAQQVVNQNEGREHLD